MNLTHNRLQTVKNKLDRLNLMVFENSAGLALYGKELYAARDEFYQLRIQSIDKQIAELLRAKEKITHDYKKEMEARDVEAKRAG